MSDGVDFIEEDHCRDGEIEQPASVETMSEPHDPVPPPGRRPDVHLSHVSRSHGKPHRAVAAAAPSKANVSAVSTNNAAAGDAPRRLRAAKVSNSGAAVWGHIHSAPDESGAAPPRGNSPNIPNIPTPPTPPLSGALTASSAAAANPTAAAPPHFFSNAGKPNHNAAQKKFTLNSLKSFPNSNSTTGRVVSPKAAAQNGSLSHRGVSSSSAKGRVVHQSNSISRENGPAHVPALPLRKNTLLGGRAMAFNDPVWVFERQSRGVFGNAALPFEMSAAAAQQLRLPAPLPAALLGRHLRVFSSSETERLASLISKKDNNAARRCILYGKKGSAKGRRGGEHHGAAPAEKEFLEAFSHEAQIAFVEECCANCAAQRDDVQSRQKKHGMALSEDILQPLYEHTITQLLQKMLQWTEKESARIVPAVVRIVRQQLSPAPPTESPTEEIRGPEEKAVETEEEGEESQCEVQE